MVKYSVSTAALFAITSLSATTINAEGLVKTSAVRAVVDEVEQQRLRKLYASVATSSHFVTDVETKCNEVIAGNPPVCVNVCETVTTIKSGDKVVEQTSKASQTKCAETTVVGVASEEWAGDGYTEVTVKNDSWKCTETGTWSSLAKPAGTTVKNVWSAPATMNKVRPAEAEGKSAKITATSQAKKESSKGGLRVSNASWGGGGRKLEWAAPAKVQVKVEPAKPKISNVGWGASASVSQKKKVEAKVEHLSQKKKVEAKVERVKTTKVTSASAWSAPAKVPAPTICIESTPTPAPTTCGDRYSTWYYNINSETCVNDDSNMSVLVGEFVNLSECCDKYFDDDCSYEDKCCSMDHHTWYYNEITNVCTNAEGMTGNVWWASDVECCQEKFNEFPCPVVDICYPVETLETDEPTEAPSPAPTKAPSPAPTTCEQLYSTWYFDNSNGKCVSGLSNMGGEAFDSLEVCCGSKYPANEFDYCMEYLNVDMCCLMKYESWYYNSIEGVCTNDPGMVGNGSEQFDDESACCIVQFGSVTACDTSNICIPEPPESSFTLPPTDGDFPLQPTVPETAETPFPSPSPSFGSTPTVSKEVTGPPTLARGGRQ
jgi:hypothetical protein